MNVLESDVVSTRSETADNELFDSFVIDTIGGREVRMDAYVSDINPDCFGAETKGYVTTTENILKFWMSAYANSAWHDNTVPEGEKGSKTNPNAAGEYFKERTASRANASSEWSIADSPEWINDIDMSFWSWSGSIGSLTNSSSSVPGPTPTVDLANDKATITYRNNGQLDLIYAFNKEKRKFDDKTGEITEGSGTYNTGYKDKMNITFYHALASVRFDISGLKNNGLTIKKVTIKNVVNDATCVIEAPETQGDPLDFAWTPSDGANNITNVATGDLSDSDFKETGLDGTTLDALMPLTSSKFLFLIPQDVQGKGITIELVYEDASHNEVTKTASLNHSTKWEAGKYYTYKLTSDDAEYNFTLASGYSSTQSFTGKKTSGSEVKYVKLKTQRKKKTDTSFKSWDYWDIQSYQIGSGSVVPVAATATSITAEDLIVTEDLANQQLKIESTRWIGKDKGGHKYWTNEDGFSGDDSGTGWSPKSWGSDGENKGVIDLSKFNYKTETETSMNTANCYIVRHAGTYKIPLVYGNGVQGGSATDAGYKFTTSGSTTNFLTTFKNHRDADITSSFIENNSNCKAKDAVIKWQDRQEAGKNPVISSVELTGNAATTYNKDNVRYIQFTVSQSDIRQTNAVIAVRDNSNNIMWSWHIWVTNDPAVKDGSITVKNKTGDYYSFFPSYALGWIDPVTYDDREDVKITLVQKTSGKTVTVTVQQATPDKEPATGVMYQWGRKDPFPSVDALSGFNTTTITSGKTLGAAIQNPSTFYMRTSNWCSSTYRNLWSGILNNTDYTVISKSNSATKKTIYDPSPVGYKVPSIYAFTNFSKTGTGFDNTPSNFNVPSGTSFDMGWNFNTGTGGTIFFYAAGWRENNPSPTWDGSPGAGKLKLGLDGNYQSAIHYGKASSTDSSQNMAYWSFNNKNMQMFNNQYQTLGCPVRPVEE